MGKVFFIGDTHFGESDIIRYEDRPYKFPEEMDEDIISKCNNQIGPDDEVWFVGDFGADGYEAEVLSNLNGTKYLIKGNHDTKANSEYRKMGFEEVYDKPILYDNFFLLSHEPQYINTKMPYVNIFAHVHGSPIYKDHSGYHYCVSVERTGNAPVSYDDIKKTVKNHRNKGK